MVPKGPPAVAPRQSPRGAHAHLGEIQAANSKMAEELEKVNTDLAQALKGLQEVRRIRIQVLTERESKIQALYPITVSIRWKAWKPTSAFQA